MPCIWSICIWEDKNRLCTAYYYNKQIKIYKSDSYQLMLKVSLVLLAITTAAYCLSPRPAHDYWFMSENPREVGDDSRWGYCDLKCLYLEHYHPNLDFVVLILTAPLRDPFAACYVKTINGFTLWSKVVKNEFY